MGNKMENLTKHLDSVSPALTATKMHLTQRIQNLDDKMDTHKEISKSIQQSDEKIGSLEYKKDLTNAGLMVPM